MDRSIGSILDGLGCGLDLDEDDLVASAVVVLKVVDAKGGRERLATCSSEGISWPERIGMLRVVEQVELGTLPVELAE